MNLNRKFAGAAAVLCLCLLATSCSESKPAETVPETVAETVTEATTVEETSTVAIVTETVAEPEPKTEAAKEPETTAAETKKEPAEDFGEKDATYVFTTNINAYGSWEAGPEDLFSLDLFGTGTDKLHTSEYYTIRTMSEGTIETDYNARDDAHAAQMSPIFFKDMEPGKIYSYAGKNPDGMTVYIDVLPDAGVVAVEGNEFTGLAFYVKEGHDGRILANYEAYITAGTVNGDEMVVETGPSSVPVTQPASESQ